MIKNKSKIITITAIIFFIIVFGQFIYSLRGTLSSTPIDFLHYYLSSESLLQGKNPYIFVPTHKLPNGATIYFNYPPTSLAFFLPLALFPIEIARLLWQGLIFLALLGAIKISFLLLKIKSSRSIWLFTISLSLLSFPIRNTFGMGQVSIFILFLILLGFYWLERKGQLKGAVALGSSIALKLFPILFLPYLLLKKKFAIFFLSLFTILAFILFSYLLIGISGWKTYFPLAPKPDFALLRANYYEQALTSFLSRLPINYEIKMPMLIIGEGILLIGSAVKIIKNKTPHFLPTEISLVLILSVLATGFNWQHYFSLLLFPFLTAFLEWKKQKRGKISLFVIISSYLLVSFNIKNPQFIIENYGFLGNLALSHVFYGGIILWLFFMTIPRKESKR